MRGRRGLVVCFVIFFNVPLSRKNFCHGQFVWPEKAADVMFAVQCSAPDADFSTKMSRLSPGLFYKEQAEMTHAKAVRVCGRANKAHLPTFKTQEDFFTGSFDYLENTDSSLQSCLEMGTDGMIKSSSGGCIDGVAKTLCLYQCAGSGDSSDQCPPSRESFSVVNSTDYDDRFPVSNILRRKPHCEDQGNRDTSIQWAVPFPVNVATPFIVFDTGCTFEATTVVLRNSPNRNSQNGGSKEIILFLATSLEEEWTEVVNTELPDMRGLRCSEQFDSVFKFPPTPARFVLFESVSIYEGHAALQYFDVY